jgi:hypothetical protein
MTHATLRERASRSARGRGIAEAGDEVGALLQEAERPVQREETEDVVLTGLPRDDQPGVFESSHEP